MSERSLKERIEGTLGTVSHAMDYTRHLLQGNRFRGDMSWVKAGAPPVLLIHGFGGTRGTMLPLTRRLQADGRAVFSYSFGTFQMASLRVSAEGLLRHVRSICEELAVPELDLVGFSMGGLVATHAVKFLQAHLWVRRMVTLGSPFAGTWVGLAGVATVGGVSPSVWQVLPGSKFLEELRIAPLPPNVKMRQIHGTVDLFCPQPGPINGVPPRDYVVLPGGHSTLVVAPHVYEAVREFLEAGDDALDQQSEAAVWASHGAEDAANSEP
jgi:hypothetical protein